MKLAHFKTLIAAALALLVVSMPVYASETDERIESSARESHVFKTYLKHDDIRIQSQDGEVILTGYVSEESHRILARETVAGLPGVISVDNRLNVKDRESSMTRSDLLIRDKVQSTLMFHRNVNAEMTWIDVKDGVVTLRGTATSLAQKDLTSEYARDIEGVIDVNNEMIISSSGDNTFPASVGGYVDDVSINSQVNMMLLFHRSTSFLHTMASTKGGVVTLTGSARNAAEIDLVTKLVSDIHGVRGVNNQMIIR